MKVYRGKYIAELYKQILDDLLNNPEYISKPRDMEVHEILNCIIEVQEPNMNLYKNKYRSSQERYIGAEILWYFCGDNTIDYIKQYTSMWDKMANETGEVNSAYGNLIFTEKNKHGYTQYQWVIDSLKKDKDTRQAFMHFNKPKHQYDGNKDQVCTLNALFHIRENKLYMTIDMRSNDVIYGFMTDFTFFNILHQQVYLHLKVYYPELQMGSYTHISHSMHLYEKHYERVTNMLTEPFEPYSTPLLNTSVIFESGMLDITRYYSIYKKVVLGIKEVLKKTDNDLINWAIDKSTEIKLNDSKTI